MQSLIERFNSENEGHFASREDCLPARGQSPAAARRVEDLLLRARCKCRVRSLAKSSRIPNTSDLCTFFLSTPSRRPHGEVKLASGNLLPKLRFIFWKRRYFQKCVNLEGGEGGITFLIANRGLPSPLGVLCCCVLRKATPKDLLLMLTFASLTRVYALKELRALEKLPNDGTVLLSGVRQRSGTITIYLLFADNVLLFSSLWQ